jgi:hypothetical protein
MDTYTRLLDDWSDDRSYHDDYGMLHDPPEYHLPEWYVTEYVAPGSDHDWTNDYDGESWEYGELTGEVYDY